jgi:hypothetical protein
VFEPLPDGVHSVFLARLSFDPDMVELDVPEGPNRLMFVAEGYNLEWLMATPPTQPLLVRVENGFVAGFDVVS